MTRGRSLPPASHHVLNQRPGHGVRGVCGAWWPASASREGSLALKQHKVRVSCDRRVRSLASVGSMIQLFQITGSCSFAARAALEEAGEEYEPVNVHPRRRDETPELALVNPLQRVPALRDGEEHRLRDGCRPALPRRAPPGTRPRAAARRARPRRAAALGDVARRHAPRRVPPVRRSALPHATIRPGTRASSSRAARGSLPTAPTSSASSPAGRGASETSSPSPTSTSTCSRAGRATRTATRSAATPLAAHYERVGARPAIARDRELDDLDERLLRHHPELRAGKPID